MLFAMFRPLFGQVSGEELLLSLLPWIKGQLDGFHRDEQWLDHNLSKFCWKIISVVQVFPPSCCDMHAQRDNLETWIDSMTTSFLFVNETSQSAIVHFCHSPLFGQGQMLLRLQEQQGETFLQRIGGDGCPIFAHLGFQLVTFFFQGVCFVRALTTNSDDGSQNVNVWQRRLCSKHVLCETNKFAAIHWPVISQFCWQTCLNIWLSLATLSISDAKKTVNVLNMDIQEVCMQLDCCKMSVASLLLEHGHPMDVGKPWHFAFNVDHCQHFANQW